MMMIPRSICGVYRFLEKKFEDPAKMSLDHPNPKNFPETLRSKTQKTKKISLRVTLKVILRSLVNFFHDALAASYRDRIFVKNIQT